MCCQALLFTVFEKGKSRKFSSVNRNVIVYLSIWELMGLACLAFLHNMSPFTLRSLFKCHTIVFCFFATGFLVSMCFEAWNIGECFVLLK